MEHEADHRQRDHRLGDLRQFLVIPGQAPPSPKPAECSLNHPSTREQDEAGRRRDPADDDQCQPEQKAGEQDGNAVVDAVGEHRLQPRVEPLQSPQQVTGAVGVLDVGGMNPDAEQQT